MEVTGSIRLLFEVLWSIELSQWIELACDERKKRAIAERLVWQDWIVPGK